MTDKILDIGGISMDEKCIHEEVEENSYPSWHCTQFSIFTVKQCKNCGEILEEVERKINE